MFHPELLASDMYADINTLADSQTDDLLNLFQSITTKLIDKYAQGQQQDGCIIRMFDSMKSVVRLPPAVSG